MEGNQMKRTLLAFALLAATAFPAERHLWLLTQTNVTGLPQTNTAATLYGVQVFCGSDDPAVTGWDIAISVLMPNGEHRTFTGQLKRRTDGPDTPYSDIWVAWVGERMDFTVERLEVTPHV
jgi:hypothetical protein